jgi:hypothetical protein
MSLFRKFLHHLFFVVALALSAAGAVGILYELSLLLQGEFGSMLNWKVVLLLLLPALVWPLMRLAILLDPEWEAFFKKMQAARATRMYTSGQPWQDSNDHPPQG